MATEEMTTVTIDVTQEDIDKGERGQCTSCPIAHALLRAMPTLCMAKVYGELVYLIPHAGNAVAVGDAPESVSDFIVSFDNFDEAEPFTFPLVVPARFVTPTPAA